MNKILLVDTSNEDGWDRGCRYFQLVNCNPHLQLAGIGHVIRFTIRERIQVLLLMKLEDGEDERKSPGE